MTIAERIINKIGSVPKTAKMLGKSPSWVYRWTYPKSRGGTGGTIPYSGQVALLEAARRGEVDVTPADFFDLPEVEDKGAA